MHNALLAALGWICLYGAYLPAVLGNTEIVNFGAVESHDVLLPHAANWTVVHHGEPERFLKVQPAPLYTALEDVCEQRDVSYESGACPHEAWLVLDLDSSRWTAYSKFTVRISWPAWSPADFSIQVHSSDSLMPVLASRGTDTRDVTILPSKSRKMYARIRLVDTGVRPPLKATTPAADHFRVLEVEPVPFNVIVEPLHLGVVPTSVVTILSFLIPAAIFAGLVLVPAISRRILDVAQEARVEITATKVAEQKSK